MPHYFSGWPELLPSGDKWIVRDAQRQKTHDTKKEAEQALERWLNLKWEAENPLPSLVDRIADALQAACDDLAGRPIDR
jgi:hypothetical protein